MGHVAVIVLFVLVTAGLGYTLFTGRPWQRQERPPSSRRVQAAKWIIAAAVFALLIVWTSRIHNEDTLRLISAVLGIFLIARLRMRNRS